LFDQSNLVNWKKFWQNQARENLSSLDFYLFNALKRDNFMLPIIPNLKKNKNKVLYSHHIFCFYVFEYKNFLGHAEFIRSLRSTVRNRIKKSNVQDFEFKVLRELNTSDKEGFLKIIEEVSIKHNSLHVPSWVLQSIIRHEKFIFFGVYHENRLVAASAGIQVGNMIWLSWIGSKKDYQKMCVNNFLYSQMIFVAINQNLNINFGRSLAGSGTAIFKLNFNLIEIPIKVSFQKYYLFVLASAIFKLCRISFFVTKLRERRFLNNIFFYIGV
jgi:hypothetical protein